MYRADDPDVCSTVLRLEREDAQVLAELLGGRPLADAPAGVQQLEGVAIDWIRVGGGADAADKTIAEAQLRTRTGASIVAVARGDDTLPAPGPDVGLEAGDVVVAVGTPEGLRGLRELLEA